MVNNAALARLSKLGGDELVVKMIDLFLTHAEPKVADLRSGFVAGNLAEVERLAHSVRSSAGNLGAEELGELAGEVEQLAAEGEHSKLVFFITQMENAFVRVKARLETERKGRAS